MSPCFKRRNHVFHKAGLGKAASYQIAASGAEQAPLEPTAIGGNQWRPYLIAETLTQHRMQIADRVDQPEIEGPAAGPKFAAEQIVADELAAAP